MSSDTWCLANRMPVCPTKIRLKLAVAWRYRTVRAQDMSLSWFLRLAVDIWFESLEHRIPQTQTYLAFMTYVGFKLTIIVFDRYRKVRASDCITLVNGFVVLWPQYFRFWSRS